MTDASELYLTPKTKYVACFGNTLNMQTDHKESWTVFRLHIDVTLRLNQPYYQKEIKRFATECAIRKQNGYPASYSLHRSVQLMHHRQVHKQVTKSPS